MWQVPDLLLVPVPVVQSMEPKPQPGLRSPGASLSSLNDVAAFCAVQAFLADKDAATPHMSGSHIHIR